MNIRTLCAFPALVVLGACASQHVSTAVSPDADEEVIGNAVAVSRAWFHKSIAASDTTALKEVLDSGIVIHAKGETLTRGASEVASLLASPRNGSGSSVRIFPSSEPELCVGGAVNGGNYAFRQSVQGQLTGSSGGSYALHWKMEPDGARVDEIVFEATETAAKRASNSACYPLSSRKFFTRRVELAFSPLSTTSTKFNDNLEQNLASSGFSRGSAISTWQLGFVDARHSPDGVDHGSTSDPDAELPRQGGRLDDASVLFATAAVRVTDLFRVEVKQQINHSTGQLQTYNATLQSRLTQKYSFQSSSAQLVASLGNFRFGAGPNLTSTEVNERYDRLTSVTVAGTTTYTPDYPVRNDSAWRHHSYGVDTQVGYAYPISSALFGYLSLHSQFANSTFAGVNTHRNWRADLSATQIGLSFGTAF